MSKEHVHINFAVYCPTLSKMRCRNLWSLISKYGQLIWHLQDIRCKHPLVNSEYNIQVLWVQHTLTNTPLLCYIACITASCICICRDPWLTFVLNDSFVKGNLLLLLIRGTICIIFYMCSTVNVTIMYYWMRAPLV